MKKHILLIMALFLAPCSMFNVQCSMIWAQTYLVGSLATPGAATFTADKIVDGVISLPFAAATETIEIETNQDATVSCDADWCQASYTDKTLTLTVTENTGEEARTAIIAVRSKDFRPLLITVKQEARLAFAVISDTHVGNSYGGRYAEKVSNTLKRLTGKGKLDAIAVVGDLTDHGDTGQYTEFVQLFGNSENFINPVDNFLFTMGNHDNYNSSGQTNFKSGLKKLNGNKLYPLDQYVLIKGYPFILISVRGGANNDDNPSNGTASYPSTVVNTLKRYLRQAAEDAPGKPIFVFTHVPPRWTCYSSWGEIEGAAWAMKVLNPVLNQYPQVVVFGGHSHYPLGDPRSIHQGANPNSSRNNYYTAINTASITYSEINPGAVDAGIHPEGFKDVTEGMILVEQPNGDIEIRRYDTYRDLEIDPEHRWVLKAPFDGSQFQYADIRDADDNPNNVPLRDGLPAPVFGSEATLTLKPTAEDVKITFPQATDNECVFRYKVTVRKGNTVVKSSFIFSQFYLNTDMPERLSCDVGGLTSGTEYTAEVIAYDSWDNQSTPLTATFTTLNDDGTVPEAVGTWTFDDPSNLLAGTGTATLTGAILKAGSMTFGDDLSAFGITPVAGQAEGNGAITIPIGSGLKMTSNLEEQSLSSYTYMFDIRSEELNGYTAIYQNDITNTKDGSFFIKNGQLGLNSNGLGYNGVLTSGKWHRVVFVVRNNLPTIYLDGRQIGQAASANNDHWLMGTGALFFIDNDGEEHRVETSEVRFWDMALSSKQVLTLGTATDEAAPEPEPVPEPIGWWRFDNPYDLFAQQGISSMMPTTHVKGHVTPYSYAVGGDGITPAAGPRNGNDAIAIPVGYSLMMTTNLGVDELNTYSVMWDIRANDISGYSPLLQNDLTNTKDGSLFILNGKVGLNGSHGLGYNGSLTAGKWHRVIFVVDSGYGTVYIDGTKVGQSSNACNEHWKLTTGALFFADNDGEEKPIITAEIRFWDKVLSDTQVQELGSVETE
ncbi:MAG: metallophosphoesterase [Bacteroidaceae bacterium]|nr:metallophosphoesterase [Bacteroidaceae bacterium]